MAVEYLQTDWTNSSVEYEVTYKIYQTKRREINFAAADMFTYILLCYCFS